MSYALGVVVLVMSSSYLPGSGHIVHVMLNTCVSAPTHPRKMRMRKTATCPPPKIAVCASSAPHKAEPATKTD